MYAWTYIGKQSAHLLFKHLAKLPVLSILYLQQLQQLALTSVDAFSARSLLARLCRVTFLHPESEQGPPQGECLQRGSYKALYKDIEQMMVHRKLAADAYG